MAQLETAGLFFGDVMFDQNWDMINGEVAHTIEYLNQSNQVNVIEALVHLLLHTGGVDETGGCLHMPNEAAVKELHRTGTLFLLHRPGEYRDHPVHVGNGSVVVYQPPASEEVAGHVSEFIQELGRRWKDQTFVQITSYCLWRLNWIHPFRNGNGRTARAFAYACLSLKLGFIPAGSPTVIDLIMENKPEYEAALSEADRTLAEQGTVDLTRMEALVLDLFIRQLQTIPDVSVPPPTPE